MTSARVCCSGDAGSVDFGCVVDYNFQSTLFHTMPSPVLDSSISILCAKTLQPTPLTLVFMIPYENVEDREKW